MILISMDTGVKNLGLCQLTNGELTKLERSMFLGKTDEVGRKMKEYLEILQTEEAIIERQVSKNVKMVEIARFIWTYYLLKAIPVKYLSLKMKISHFLGKDTA